jgi:GNAT superfamily N-acetyltransferase
VRIREAGPEDAPALAPLLAELGYPDKSRSVEARLRGFERDPASFVLVARDEGAVVGLAAATLVPLLHEDGSWCRLSALVVGERSRRAGIGAALVAAVVERALAGGCRYLEVTSGERPDREAAHAFYEALGLEQVSRRYLKTL